MNIVIIDNNFAIRQVLSIFIKKLEQSFDQEISIFTAHDGVEGLGLIYAASPDLIIIDTTLPKYSGKEVLDFVTQNETIQQAGVPILVLSESPTSKELKEKIIIIDKSKSDFLDRVLKFIAEKLDPKQKLDKQKLPYLLSTAKTTLKLANWTDTVIHRFNDPNQLIKPFIYLAWVVLEFISSLFLTLILLAYGPAKDKVIQQKNRDNIILRIRLLPAIGIFFVFLILLLINTALNVSFQSILLKETTDSSIAATTFIVDSTADTSDFDTGDDLCDTDDSVGDSPCTLRAAMEQANVTTGTDNIDFNISGSAPFVITPATNLPVITDSLNINGYSQPGSALNTQAAPSALDSVITIEIDASNYVFPESAFIFDNTSNSKIAGLAIYGFDRTGVNINDSSAISISGNYIGTDSTGLAVLTLSGNNILIERDSDNNFIGGPDAEDRNLIVNSPGYGIRNTAYNSGNTQVLGNIIGLGRDGNTVLGNSTGIYFEEVTDVTVGAAGAGNVISGNSFLGISMIDTNDITIQANYIGVDSTGLIDKGNTSFGIDFNTVDDVYIGGANSNQGNVISGNDSTGLYLLNSDNFNMQSNIVGLGSDGSTVIGNVDEGVYLRNVDNLTVGDATGAGNIISGNGKQGLVIEGLGDTITVEGNKLGTDINGTIGKANGWHGLQLDGTLSNIIIGGSTGLSTTGPCQGSCNLISGNNYTGIDVAVPVSGTSKIIGNYIGTDINGTVALPNLREGIDYSGVSGWQIGESGAGNIISGNDDHGIQIQSDTTDTTIAYNYIGTGPNDSGSLPNQGHGIRIDEEVNTLTINDNTIRNNTEAGISLFNNQDALATILRNNISDNTEIGIDLARDGLTPNDSGDIDTGPNTLQNHPFVISSTTSGSSTDFRFELDTNTAGNYVIEFFENQAQEPSGFGDGENYLCSDTVTHTGGGSETFIITCSQNPTVDYFITSTATQNPSAGIYEHTSEYGNNVIYANYAIDVTNDSETTSENTPVTIDVVDNDSDANGSADIDLSSLTISSQPINGDTEITNDKVEYTPDNNFTGNDSFQYEICDQLSICSNGTVNVSVSSGPTNTPTTTPTNTPTSEPTQENSPTPTSSSIQTQPATPIHTPTTTPSPTPTITPTTPQPLSDNTVIKNTPTPTKGATQPIDPNIILGYSGTEDIIDPTLHPTPATDTAETADDSDEVENGDVLSNFTRAIRENKGSTAGIGAAIISTPLIITSFTNPGITLYAILWFTSLKRKRPWGLVYDEETKEPVPFATIYASQEGKEKASSVSNLDGKYQIYPEPGRYELTIKHPKYGDQTKHIQIDADGPKEFVEFALSPKGTASKGSSPSLKPYLKKNLPLINKILFSIALAYSLAVTIISPTLFNILILLLFFVQISIALLIITKKEPRWGTVTNEQTNTIVPREFVRLLDGEKQLDITLTNANGGYGFIVSPGTYTLKVDNYNIFDGDQIKPQIDHKVENEEAININLFVSEKTSPSTPF